jgi:hypothetical protein
VSIRSIRENPCPSPSIGEGEIVFALENLVKIGDLCIIGVANRLGAPLTPAVRIFIACQGDGMAGNTQEMSYVPVSGQEVQDEMDETFCDPGSGLESRL